MAEEKLVEEGFVPVLKRRQEKIAVDVVAGLEIVAVGSRGLLGVGRDARREETAETELVPLLLREAGAFV